jgi:hypothetical protein
MVLVVQFEEVEEAFAQFEENNSKSISKYERGFLPLEKLGTYHIFVVLTTMIL